MDLREATIEEIPTALHEYQWQQTKDEYAYFMMPVQMNYSNTAKISLTNRTTNKTSNGNYSLELIDYHYHIKFGDRHYTISSIRFNPEDQTQSYRKSYYGIERRK